MSVTRIALMLTDFTFLILGLAVLNWIFRPKNYKSYDFILMVITVSIFYAYVIFGVALVYGVEHL